MDTYKCINWFDTHGVTEEMVKRADAFSLIRNDAMIDLRREQVPAGVLLTQPPHAQKNLKERITQMALRNGMTSSLSALAELTISTRS